MTLFLCGWLFFRPLEYGYTKGKKKGKTLFFEIEVLRINDMETLEEDTWCWCCNAC